MGGLTQNLAEGVTFTRLPKITASGGHVLHGIKKSDPTYAGFGEVYFSQIETGALKGWKRHRKMVMNIIVVVGSIDFFIYRQESSVLTHINCSSENYGRLTVDAGLWVAFRGMGSSQSMLMNVASIEHDPTEADQINAGQFFIDV